MRRLQSPRNLRSRFSFLMRFQNSRTSLPESWVLASALFDRLPRGRPAGILQVLVAEEVELGSLRSVRAAREPATHLQLAALHGTSAPTWSGFADGLAVLEVKSYAVTQPLNECIRQLIEKRIHEIATCH